MRPLRPATLAVASLLVAAACAEPPPKKRAPASATAPAPSRPSASAVASTSAPAPTAPPATSAKVDPACATNGCLREVTKVGDYGREQLQPYLQPGVRITTGYSVYVVRFATDGASPKTESTGVVTIPYPATPPPGGFHVGGNNHGTIGVDDPCAPSKSLLGVGHAGWFGARGMIGVAPDYPGLGTAGVHPYLVSRSEGAAALDALRAARALAAHLGVPTSGRFVSVGLSQGGHATIAAAALHQAYAPDLDVRAFAAAAPASAWASHWSKGVALGGAQIHAMLMYAWSKHYGWPSDKPLWKPEFAARMDELFATQCTVPTQVSGPTLFTSISPAAAGLFDPAFLAAYHANDLHDYPYVSQAFDANALAPYPQTAPLRIYQGDIDDVVPAFTTVEIADKLRAGGVNVDHVIVRGANHLTTAFGVYSVKDLASDDAMAWLRSKLE